MPNGLRIADGAIPWDSPAIKLFENRANLNAGSPEVNANHLAKSVPTYFAVEVGNTSGNIIMAQCAHRSPGQFVPPRLISTQPVGASFSTTLVSSQNGWTVIITENATGNITSEIIDGVPDGIWYPYNMFVGTPPTAVVRFKSNITGNYHYLFVNPQNGQSAIWNSGIASTTSGLIDGFGPRAEVFVAYVTTGNGSAIVKGFRMATMSETTFEYKFPVDSAHAFNLYFTPSGDWLARVPNQPNTEIEFTYVSDNSRFGSSITPTIRGMEVQIVVQGATAQNPLEVLSTGDAVDASSPFGIKIEGQFDVRVNGISFSSNTNPPIGKIDYRCLKELPKLEVQVQPASSANINKLQPDAYAYFTPPDPLAPPTLVRCLQPWSAPFNTVPNTPNAHFCAIAEAFTPVPINGVDIPQTVSPSYVGLISEENIAQQNMLITTASSAKVVFTACNPLPFDAVATLTMRSIKSCAKRFRNWPKLEAEITLSGMRQIDSGKHPAEKLRLKMSANSTALIETVVDVKDGSLSPSAAAFEIVQTLQGVTVGGVAVIVTHEAPDLELIETQRPVVDPPCPIQIEQPCHISYSAVDPSPGSAPGLYLGLVGQRVGAFFVSPIDIKNASVYAESTSHVALDIEGVQINVGYVTACTPFFASWAVKTTGLPAGQHALTLVAQADGFEPVRLLLELKVFESMPWKPSRPWYETQLRIHEP